MTQGLHLVSLGCPTNRVDAEAMIGVSLQRGYHHEPDPEKA